MTFSQYIAAINSRLKPPLHDSELTWAHDAYEGDISPDKFADWIVAVTATNRLEMTQ